MLAPAFCPSCGAKSQVPGAVFCANCGANMSAAQPAQPSAAQPDAGMPTVVAPAAPAAPPAPPAPPAPAAPAAPVPDPSQATVVAPSASPWGAPASGDQSTTWVATPPAAPASDWGGPAQTNVFAAPASGDLSGQGGAWGAPQTGTPAWAVPPDPSQPWAAAAPPSASFGGAGYSGGAPAMGTANLLAGKSPKVIAEVAIGIAAVVALFLPLLSVSNVAASASLSTWDYLTKLSGLDYSQIALVTFGSVAALLLSLVRFAGNAKYGQPWVPMIGFAAVAVGAIWYLISWGSNIKQVTSYYSVSASQGIGLWLLLAAGVGGVIVCFLDLQPGFLSQPPSYPGQPPQFPGQPPSFPGQPPQFPGQPPSF